LEAGRGGGTVNKDKKGDTKCQGLFLSRKIVFSNQKGGVGKTTSCRELGISLSLQGKKVLLVDTDPQGNLSKSLMNVTGAGLYYALTDGQVIIDELTPTLSILPGDIRLSLLEKNLLGEIDAYQRLSELFELNCFKEFDFILIDTPPSLGILTLNALAASDALVIPVSCRMYSLQGTNDLMNTVSKVRKNLNPDLKLLGVLINAFDRVPVIMKEIREEIEKAFGEAVFSQVISKSVRVEEAISEKKGITELSTRDRIKEDILSLTHELLSRSSL
jgi:chromosome partitioning protein